jgi:hypothetical protein
VLGGCPPEGNFLREADRQRLQPSYPLFDVVGVHNPSPASEVSRAASGTAAGTPCGAGGGRIPPEVQAVLATLSEGDRERLLVALNRLTESDPMRNVDLAVVASEVGVSLEQARVIALQLEARDWLKTSLHPEGGTVCIRPAGLDAAECLQLPWWRRWMDDRAIVVGVVVAIVSAVMSALLTAIFTRLIVGH